MDIDKLIKELPRVEASNSFQAGLLDDALGVQAVRAGWFSRHIRIVAPVAMAASLAIGVFIGAGNLLSLQSALSGFGLNVASEELLWEDGLDIYAETFDSLAS